MSDISTELTNPAATTIAGVEIDVSQKRTLGAVRKDLKVVTKSVIEAYEAQDAAMLDFGEKLAGAYTLVHYKRGSGQVVKGGWGVYCKDSLPCSEWTANRYLAAYRLFLQYPSLQGMLEGLEVHDLCYKMASNGEKSYIETIEQAIAGKHDAIEFVENGKVIEVKMPEEKLNSGDIKKIVAHVKKEGATVSDETEETSEEDTEETSEETSEEATEVWHMDKVDLAVLKEWIEDVNPNDEGTDAVLQHIRMCWQLIDDITGGDAKYIKQLRKLI